MRKWSLHVSGESGDSAQRMTPRSSRLQWLLVLLAAVCLPWIMALVIVTVGIVLAVIGIIDRRAYDWTVAIFIGWVCVSLILMYGLCYRAMRIRRAAVSTTAHCGLDAALAVPFWLVVACIDGAIAAALYFAAISGMSMP